MAIRAAFGGLIAAAILGVGAVGASASPNPGFGQPFAPIPVFNSGGTYKGAELNPGPGFNFNFAQTDDGPQSANVPTLAWVGEDVRLVACDNNIAPDPLNLAGIAFQQAEWNTNLWTGDQAYQSTPTFDGSQATNLYVTNTGSASFFFPTGADEHYNGCTSADISSLHAGLDEVTLNVYQQSAEVAPNIVAGNSNSPAGGPGLNLDPSPVFSEQFIVIWMTANAPTLTEASEQSLEFPSQADGTPSTATSLDSATGQLSADGVENAVTGGGSNSNGLPFLGDGLTPGTFAGLDSWGSDVAWDPSIFSWDHNSNDTPITNNGLVDVKVTGSFPVEDAPPSTTNANYFASVTKGTGSITLPNSWVALANLMATSSTQNTADNTQPTGGSLWDIHGGPTNPLGHAGDGPNSFLHPHVGICGWDGTSAAQFDLTTDAVDDCVSDGHGDGNAFAFSRVFGDVTALGGTVGPYDALAPNSTLLSDGRLNSDDAPMPALPVTLSIAGNSGNPGDISGIGGLYGVAKYLVYSHDFDNTDASPAGAGHPTALTTTGLANLYNPFYQSYIPSTLRPIQEASGVTGVYQGGAAGTSGTDFPGFSLGYTDPYTYWKAFNSATVDTGGNNGCYRSDISGNGGPIGDYQKPDYPTSVTVYTDERGEAYVDYNPGTGFYDNGFTPDQNGACDLQSLYGKAIGTSTISATTAYPYEAVPYFPPAGANTLTKTVDSEWSKTLTAYPKNNLSGGTGGANISIVVAHAQDVNGQGFSDELVCFSNNAGASMNIDTEPSVSTGTTTIDLDGSAPATAPVGTSGYVCGTTNTDGNVAVEVAQSNSPSVDVLGWFTDEHIFRDVEIPALGQTDPVSSTTPPTVLPADKVVLQSGSTGGGGSAAGSSSGSSSSAPSASVAPTTPLSVGAGNSCKVNSFHLYGKKGYAQLKVSCTQSKTDSVVLRTYRSNGKLLHTYRKTVKVGKTVRIYLSTRKVAHTTVSV